MLKVWKVIVFFLIFVVTGSLGLTVGAYGTGKIMSTFMQMRMETDIHRAAIQLDLIGKGNIEAVRHSIAMSANCDIVFLESAIERGEYEETPSFIKFRNEIEPLLTESDKESCN